MNHVTRINKFFTERKENKNNDTIIKCKICLILNNNIIYNTMNFMHK